MRKTRKGFTLVELLIVVAIRATLTAAMTSSITGTTAKAKAAMIARNVETLKNAAATYYGTHMDMSDGDAFDAVTTTNVIEEYVSTWADFNRDDGTITYTADDEATGTGLTNGVPNWNVTVDFSGDGEATTIATELAKVPGFGTYKGKGDTASENKLDGNKFKVYLYTGRIVKVTTASTGG